MKCSRCDHDLDLHHFDSGVEICDGGIIPCACTNSRYIIYNDENIPRLD